MQTKITVTMSPQLKRNLKASYTVKGPVREYLTRAVEVVRQEAVAEAPEDLGEMKRSHTGKVESSLTAGKGVMEVTATSKKGAPYPLFVHEGTKPHFPPIEDIAPWAQRHGIEPGALAMSIARKGTKANPWLERSLEKSLPKISKLSDLATAIEKKWNAP